MKKNKLLNQWLWRWHFIAGLISLPFIVVLSITGGIYLFKDKYEKPIQEPITTVEAIGTPISYQKQWELANARMEKKPNAMVVPMNPDQATEFVSGRFSHKTSLFVDPYRAKVSGTVKANEGLMYKVRKLHGELLMGSFGTKVVELVASWLVVLILTGVYVFWPTRNQGLKAFFIPRVKEGKRIFFRDVHAISGFWISGLLLLVLAGAFPWTDVVGSNFKWVQDVTQTGYPNTWMGIGLKSETGTKKVSLDDMVETAKALELPGTVSIGFPKSETGVYSISNTYYSDLEKQVKYHYDQFSGEPVLKQTWADVGVLMRGRMWVMAFHQGQFGAWNWYLMLLVALLLAVMGISALVSYSLRKRKGHWGIPKVSKNFNAGYGVVIALIFMGVLFPLFGLSLLLIWMVSQVKVYFRKKRVPAM
ncbi:PepSY-associated TM helix domain-containing protein [Zobellia uliginosa]|uniref:PepSY-associated TM helix domain-containing protein n=1 Tax=Zobellia uliginosa TaxID=143224 RepID=UPI0026E2EE93|nr:PepSY domain-containing protein [Zobellia uliginosa]MDO6517767.1 PepSY domain-containing protein [Zobellia uliginosa]